MMVYGVTQRLRSRLLLFGERASFVGVFGKLILPLFNLLV